MQNVWRSQGNKASVSTEGKDQDARIVVGVKFVSTAEENQNAKAVAEVRFVSITR